MREPQVMNSTVTTRTTTTIRRTTRGDRAIPRVLRQDKVIRLREQSIEDYLQILLNTEKLRFQQLAL